MTQHPKTFQSFNEFYPFYLSQHRNSVCRYLHVLGIMFSLGIVLLSLIMGAPEGILAAPLVGYACSWTGHFVFEKNKPATFGYPLYSLLGDFKMTWQSLTAAIGYKPE